MRSLPGHHFLATAIALLLSSCAPGREPAVAELRAGVAKVPLVYASSARIPIDWRLLREEEPAASPLLFVHLLDGSGRVLRTYDRPIPGTPGEGEDAIEIWQSVLAEPLPRGSYRLTAGVYDAVTRRRWRLETNGVEIDEGEYEIAAIEIDATRRRTPDLVLEGEWHPPEASSAQQNPGRRSMGDGGTIRLLRTAAWSELVLTLSMTELPASQYRLVYDDDASAPRVVIRNGCDSGSETRFDGYGVWSVALRLDAGDGCSITFDPSFVTVDGDGKRRSVGLEAAFFRSLKRPVDIH